MNQCFDLGDDLVTYQKVEYKYGISRNKIAKLQKNFPDFPKPFKKKIQRGPFSKPTISVFNKQEIEKWLQENPVKEKRAYRSNLDL